jgi:hypothetical protein
VPFAAREVIEQLRDSNYWEGFRAAVKMHEWDLSQYHQATMSPEMQEQLAEQMRSLKERRKFKSNN